LTRVSIDLSQKAFSKWMDCRIKSGNDVEFVEAQAFNYHRQEKEKPMPRPAIQRVATDAIGREVAELPTKSAKRRAGR